ncbi:hypothetical protein AG1IA_08881 [Rhizoctonia solani AG-1 IA]|uniref:Uncharacterized protein n=1 Tax=Thanatephorus cucumeris (strain AG1-IA) TaxID=983506 RepID=L8WGK6_THACA|nr:hypothetical protein AG1IA_08881 [Rhizoctonia solani AG-1 IA]
MANPCTWACNACTFGRRTRGASEHGKHADEHGHGRRRQHTRCNKRNRSDGLHDGSERRWVGWKTREKETRLEK